MVKSPGLFDVDERLRRLSDIGDQLEAYASADKPTSWRCRSEKGSSLEDLDYSAGRARFEVRAIALV